MTYTDDLARPKFAGEKCGPKQRRWLTQARFRDRRSRSSLAWPGSPGARVARWEGSRDPHPKINPFLRWHAAISGALRAAGRQPKRPEEYAELRLV